MTFGATTFTDQEFLHLAPTEQKLAILAEMMQPGSDSPRRALLWQITDEPRVAAWTSVRGCREELIQEGLSDGGQAGLGWRPLDSFFPHSPH